MSYVLLVLLILGSLVIAWQEGATLLDKLGYFILATLPFQIKVGVFFTYGITVSDFLLVPLVLFLAVALITNSLKTPYGIWLPVLGFTILFFLAFFRYALLVKGFGAAIYIIQNFSILAMALVIYWFLCGQSSDAIFRFFYKIITFQLIALTCIGVMHYFTPLTLDYYLDHRGSRFSGTFKQSNQFSMYYLPFFPFLLDYIREGQFFRTKVFSWVALIGLFLLTLLSGSDGNLFFALIVLFIYIGFHSIKTLLISAGLGIFFYLNLDRVMDFLQLIAVEFGVKGLIPILIMFRALTGNVQDGDSELGGERIKQLQIVIEQFVEHPLNFLFGFGPSQFAYLHRIWYGHAQSLHNTPVRILFEYGLLYFAVFSLLGFWVMRLVMHRSQNRGFNISYILCFLLMFFMSVTHWYLKTRFVIFYIVLSFVIIGSGKLYEERIIN